MLDSESKNRIITAAKQVYWAYLSLEIANKPIRQNELSLDEQINLAIEKENFSSEVTLGGQRFQCQIKKINSEVKAEAKERVDDKYEITLGDVSVLSGEIGDLKKYSDKQKQHIVTARQFFARKTAKSSRYVLSTSLSHGGETLEIGGPDKIDLYRSHIANLGIMIKALASKKMDFAMLASLATGSGKSFTQALWVLVLHLAKVGGLFATPSALVDQLYTDIKRLIPDSVGQHLHKIEDIDQIDAKETHPLAIVSYEALFSNAFLDSIHARFNPKDSFLSFDEQHVVSEREDRAVKLRYITREYTSLFLTATPTRNSYQLSGNKTVLSMSKKQKENQGYAVPSKSIQEHSPTFKKKIATSGRGWFKRKADKLLSSFANAIVEELYSPVDEMLRQARYQFVAKKLPSQCCGRSVDPSNRDQLRDFLRWNVSIPAADKMLIITHDHDTLINLLRGLEDKEAAQAIYKDGNLIERRNIYDLFQIDNVEDAVTTQFDKRQQAVFKSSMEAYIKKAGYEDAIIHHNPVIASMTTTRTMKEFAKATVFCSIVNNALRVVTGFDLITLDDRRYFKLDELCQQIQNKLHNFNKTVADLKKEFCDKDGLDDATAGRLATEVDKVIHYLRSTVDDSHVKALVDNWVFDAKDNMARVYGRAPFDWSLGYTRFVCQDLEKNHEAKIEDNVVYETFTETHETLREPDGQIKLHAKKRQHNAIEIFNDDALEYSYRPQQPDAKMTVEQLKSAFKLGLVPYMVGNTLVEGFNDPNLNVTVNLVANTQDKSNQPAKIIQAAGRNRGLNSCKMPVFIQVHNQGAETVFSLQSLDKEDYIPDFLNSTESYNQRILENQGKRMAIKVKEWVHSNLKSNGSVDAEALKNYVFNLAIESILQLNKGNDHRIHRSRKKFVAVLKSLKNELHLSGHKIRNTYQLSFFVRMIGNALNFVCRLVYRPYQTKAYKAVAAQVTRLADEKEDHKKQRGLLYHKIVGKDFSVIQKNAMTFKTLGNMLADQANKIKKEIDSDNTKLINKDELNALFKSEVTKAVNNAKTLHANKHGEKKKFVTDLAGSKVPSGIKAAATHVILLSLDQLPEEKGFDENCDHLNAMVASRDDWADILLKSGLHQLKEIAPLGEKIQEILLQDAQSKAAVDRFGDTGKVYITASLSQSIQDNSTVADVLTSLNISRCENYSNVSDLVHHPLFSGILSSTINAFSDEELQMLLESTDEMKTEHESELRVLNVINLVNDLAQLNANDFNDKYIKYTRTMDKSRSILDDCKKLFMAIYHCHLYFHQADEKGMRCDTRVMPKLVTGLGLDAASMRVQPNPGSFFGKNATKAFFMKAIKDSLPEINSLYAKVHHKQVSCLERVANDIVSPMCSVLKYGRRWGLFSKAGQDTQDAVKFAQNLNKVKPLSSLEARTNEHCLVGLKRTIGG